MDIRRRSILLFLFFPIVAFSLSNTDSTALVRFIVRADSVAAGDTVFISGNHTLLGNWHPAKIPLHADKNNVWTRQLIFKKGTRLKYKFTRGDWGKEAIYQLGQIPGDSDCLILNDTTIIVHIPGWKDQQKEYFVRGQITGDVKYHHDIEAYGLKPRDVIVWLPPGYEKDLTRHYPVLYMHDGQNIIDPATSVGGNDWQLDETADSLIKNKRIMPLIIVGIYNTPDRSLEYLETPTANLYIKLVVDVIKPMIDSSYRTRPEREYTATGGSSAAGLLSFMLLWEYPDIFSRAACISPVFKLSSEKYDIDYTDNVINDHNNTAAIFTLY